MAKPKGIKQIWFVSPIMVEQDHNKPLTYPGESNANVEEEVQEAQPARHPNVRPMTIDTGKDFGFSMVRNNVITMAWNTKSAAENYAKEMAGKNPKTAYGVFSCVDVFETTVPEVIEKQFNDQGELVVKATSKEKQDVI
jgi:hypothetical protein